MGRKWVILVAAVIYTAFVGAFILTAFWALERRLRREIVLLLQGRHVVNAHKINR